MRFLAILALLPTIGWAQTATVSKTVPLKWTLPTESVEGLPLTGNLALSSVQVFVSTSPIADNSTAEPTFTISGAASTGSYTTKVANGQTLYFRIKVCNAVCSNFGNQASKLFKLDETPGVPTNLTIEVEVVPAQP